MASELLMENSKWRIYRLPWWIRWLRKYKLCLYTRHGVVATGGSMSDLYAKFRTGVDKALGDSMDDMSRMLDTIDAQMRTDTHLFVNFDYVSVELRRLLCLMACELKFGPTMTSVRDKLDYQYNTDLDKSQMARILMLECIRQLGKAVDAEKDSVEKLCGAAAELISKNGGH